MKEKQKTYVADFETTTKEDDCHVWAYAITEVGNSEEVIIGTNIDDFMKWCEEQPTNVKVFFHNLKFDGRFIIDWLFRHEYRHVEKSIDRESRTFTTLISDKGLFYSMDVVFKLRNKKINHVVFQDSLKLIPLSVDAIAKAFHLPIQKGKIDYARHDNLPAGTPLTSEEEEYIKNDVRIVAHAINYFFEQGLDKMTIGACALEEYKKLIKKRNFKRYFPTPQYHDDVKQSYKGGFTYLYPLFTEKRTGRGIVLDVNSLYPSVMYQNRMPFGTPIFFKGEYEEDIVYPLYTQMIKCSFRLKKGKIPTIQIKHNPFFKGNEYLTDSNNQEVAICLNSVDLELFFEHYDVYNLEYISGWKFKATRGLFTDYIDKWSNSKIKAKEEGNHGLYLISKLFLNSLYGKFGTDTKIRSKIPYYKEEDDRVHFRDSEVEFKDGIYIAIASFITSYARHKTISAFQNCLDRYNQGLTKAIPVYADTDSLHIVLNGEDEEKYLKECGLDIDSTKLGAWDHEMTFKRAKYIRQKTYIEDEIISEKKYIEGKESETPFLYSKDSDGFYKLKITVAGMPSECYRHVNFRNFKVGATYKGKLQPKTVAGGVILKQVEFTIKE